MPWKYKGILWGDMVLIIPMENLSTARLLSDPLPHKANPMKCPLRSFLDTGRREAEIEESNENRMQSSEQPTNHCKASRIVGTVAL